MDSDNFAQRDRAVTANGSVPGPLISANMGDRLLVRGTDSYVPRSDVLIVSLQINVTNYLLDPAMRRSTSIVSQPESCRCVAMLTFLAR